MPVKEILIVRHGDREPWTLDPTSGEYTSATPYPSGLPGDPPLAPTGVDQSHETARYLHQYLDSQFKEDRLRIYSSPFYRCLETLKPTVEGFLRLNKANRAVKVRGERGIGEWFGAMWFNQPEPATPARLRRDFFPWLDDTYSSKLIPAQKGEKIATFHNRVAKALSLMIRDVDREYEQAGRGNEDVTILLCSHAATVIATGRSLTGQCPEDYTSSEFSCFTGGISKYVRRPAREGHNDYSADDWRSNGGVAGGWDCVLNSDCSHLASGRLKGWCFSGEEQTDSYQELGNNILP